MPFVALDQPETPPAPTGQFVPLDSPPQGQGKFIQLDPPKVTLPGWEKPAEGWWGNIGRQAVEQVYGLEANIYGLAGRTAKTLGAEKFGADLEAEAKRLEGVSLGSQESQAVPEMKEAWRQGEYFTAAKNLVKAGAEGALASAPWMAVAAASGPAYAMLLLEEVARERARNKGKEEPDWQDVAEAAPFAIPSALIDKWSLGKLLKAGQIEKVAPGVLAGLKAYAGAVGKGLARETVTEAVQEPLEYAGETVGTPVGFKPEEAGLRSLLGGAGGLVMGGVGRGITAVPDVISAQRETGVPVPEFGAGEQVRPAPSGGEAEQLELPLTGGMAQPELPFEPGREELRLTEGAPLLQQTVVVPVGNNYFLEPMGTRDLAQDDRVVVIDRRKVMPSADLLALADEMGINRVELPLMLEDATYDPTMRGALLDVAKSRGFAGIAWTDPSVAPGEMIIPFGERVEDLMPDTPTGPAPQEQLTLPLGAQGQLEMELPQGPPPPPPLGLTPPPGTVGGEPTSVDMPVTGVVDEILGYLQKQLDRVTTTLTSRGQTLRPLVQGMNVPDYKQDIKVQLANPQADYEIEHRMFLDPVDIDGNQIQQDRLKIIEALDRQLAQSSLPYNSVNDVPYLGQWLNSYKGFITEDALLAAIATAENPGYANQPLPLRVKGPQGQPLVPLTETGANIASALKEGQVATMGWFAMRNEVARLKALGMPVSADLQDKAKWEERVYKFMMPLIRTMFDKYTPDGKLVVAMRPDGWMGGGGHFMSLGNGAGVIHVNLNYDRYGRAKAMGSMQPAWLSSSRLAIAEAKALLMETGTHEGFGHFLFAHTFEKADLATQQAVVNEYREWLESMRGKTFKDVLETTSVAKLYEDLWGSFYSQPANQIDTGINFKSRYWLSMDEWAARRMADLLMKDILQGKVHGPTTHFWRNLGRKLLAFFRDMHNRWLHKDSSLEMFVQSLSLANRMKYLQKYYVGPNATGLVDPTKMPEHPSNPESKALMDLLAEEPTRAPPTPQAPSTINTFAALKRRYGLNIDEREFARGQARFNGFMKWMLTLPQLERENISVPGMTPFTDAVRSWWATKGQWTAKWDGWVDEVRRSGYGKAELSRLWRFANEVTVRSDELERKLTDVELAAIAQQVGGLDDGLVGLWRGGRGILQQALDELELSVIARMKEQLGRIEGTELQIALEEKRIRADFAKMRNRDYWPLSRFGKYTVHVKATKPLTFMGKSFAEGETVMFELYETVSAQLARKQELLKAHPGFVEVAAGVVDESLYSYMGMPETFLKVMQRELIDSTGEFFTGDAAHDKELVDLRNKQLEAINVAMLHFTPENAFKQRLLRRKLTRGFSDDGLRGMASLGQSFAGHIARSKHRGEMNAALKTMDGHRRGVEFSTDPDMLRQGNKLGQLLNTLKEWQYYLNNPQNDLANLRALGFLNYLGFVPRAAFVQVFQPFFTTLPWMASRYGDAAAGREFVRSYAMTKRLFQQRQGTLRGDLDEALRLGIDAGFLNQSLFTELAGLAEGSNLQRLLPGTFLKSQEAAAMIRKAGFYAGWLFQKGEELNRLVTFRAVYDLELKTLLDLPTTASDSQVEAKLALLSPEEQAKAKDEAFKTGRTAVETTQGEYSRWARPKLMRGKMSAVTLFKMYPQIMTYFTARDPGAWRFLVLQASLAGALGLPFAEDIADLASVLMEWLGMGEGDVRNLVRDSLQELGANPDLVMHGLGRHATPWDLSGSWSLGRIIPTVEPATQVALGQPLQDAALRVQSEALGVLFSIPLNWVKAISSGEERDFEQAMPTVVRDVYRTYRRFREGGERTRGGALMVPIDRTDPVDVSVNAMQALGFRPTEVAVAGERRWAQKETERYWATRRKTVVDAFYELYKQGTPDREAQADVMGGIKEFNGAVPWPEMKISAKQLRQGLRQSIRRQKLEEAGQPAAKKYRRLYQEIEEGFR